MRSIRLLPVVIFAALALLVFKGIGLVNNGGYVLTGPTAVMAQEGNASDMSLPATPSEATLDDTSPVMGDTAPTLPTASSKAESASSGEGASSAATSSTAPAADAHGAPTSSSAAAASAAPSSAAAADAHGASSTAAADATVCPDTGSPSKPPASGELTDKIGTALASPCASTDTAVNAHGDALPTTKDGNGKIVPLQVAEGDNDSQQALLQRLTERRAELDKRQADLDMRESIVAAAEQKLDEKTKALEALQAQVASLVDEKAAADDAGFKGIVAMYEQMKPKDAAKIFDTLNLNVLLKIARAMNPRKVSPILAAMSPEPAQALTTALATTDTQQQAAAAPAGENLTQLPQIVGH